MYSIDPNDHTLLTFSELARVIPSRNRRGRGINISTLFRWANPGIRGVRLETRLIGGGRFSSLYFVSQFINKLSQRTESTENESPSKGVASPTANGLRAAGGR